MNKKVHYPIRRVFILDELAIVLALLLSLLIRLPNYIMQWHSIVGGLYVSFAITLCLFHVIIFLLYDNRKNSIFEQDPIENLMTVIKSRCILMALSLLYLYAIQESKQSSRTIILLFFVISIILGYAFRMLYRRVYLKNNRYLYEQNTYTVSRPYPSNEELKKLLSEKRYDEVVVCVDPNNTEETERLVQLCEQEGVRVYCTM